jgi:hypothetical protein
LARFNVLFGYLACTTGLLVYEWKFNEKNEDYALVIVNIIGFSAFTILIEIWFRLWLKWHENEQI